MRGVMILRQQPWARMKRDLLTSGNDNQLSTILNSALFWIPATDVINLYGQEIKLKQISIHLNMSKVPN